MEHNGDVAPKSYVVFIDWLNYYIHLSRLTGTPRHPDKQKNQIIWFFFENRLN